VCSGVRSTEWSPTARRSGPAGEVYVVSCEEGNPNNNVSILQYPTAGGRHGWHETACRWMRESTSACATMFSFWSDDMVYDAINAAIMSFYSFFAVEKFWTTAAVMNQYEYALLPDCQYIRRVQIVGLTSAGTDRHQDGVGTIRRLGAPWTRTAFRPSGCALPPSMARLPASHLLRRANRARPHSRPIPKLLLRSPSPTRR